MIVPASLAMHCLYAQGKARPQEILHLMTVAGGPRQLRSDQKRRFTCWWLLLRLPAPLLRHAPAAATTGVMAPAACVDTQAVSRGP